MQADEIKVTKVTGLCLKNIWGHSWMLRVYFNIGIKHDFLCINICWAPREVLKPEPERRGFQHLPRGPADVNVSEKPVWSLLFNFFFARKPWRNCFKKFFLPVPIMARKRTLLANVLRMPLSGQRLTSSLLCSLLLITSVFMTTPECLFVKPLSRALTACELPC